MTRQPVPIAEIVADLMARRGFARVRSVEMLERAWTRVVAVLEAGNLIIQHTQVGSIRQGRLEVIVDHSALIQELEFQKATLLKSLTEQLPDEKIRELRFRLGTIQ